MINSLLHWDGYQPSARGFGQYWGLKSCRPINTLCAPVSAPSRLLHLPLPAGGLAHGFPFSTAWLHSVSHTPSAPSFFFYFSTNSPCLTPPIFPLISYSFLLERSRLTECLNWKQAVGRLSVWGWNSIWSASHGISFFFLTGLFAVVERTSERQSVEMTRRHLDGCKQSEWQEKMQNEDCTLQPSCRT